MKKLTQPWKLRRSFGSQPVGNVDGPRWPEAGGIAVQVISALPSRRTLRGKVDTHCRPALSGCLTSVTAQRLPPPSTPRSWISPQVSRPSHACPPEAQQLSERRLRCYRAAQSSSILSFPWQRRGTTFESMQAFSLMSSLCVVRRSSILLPN